MKKRRMFVTYVDSETDDEAWQGLKRKIDLIASSELTLACVFGAKILSFVQENGTMTRYGLLPEGFIPFRREAITGEYHDCYFAIPFSSGYTESDFRDIGNKPLPDGTMMWNREEEKWISVK